METVKYKTRKGTERVKPVAESEDELYSLTESNDGFCLACGNVQAGVEPDARGYVCEACEEKAVYGFEELLIMGLFGFSEE